MNTTHLKKKVSFLSIALGSLIVTSLGTVSTEALPFSCTLKCTKNSVSKDATRLNDCASKCDNTKIIDILVPNAEKLNADNQKHYQTALKYQQSIIEKQLKAETSKKKPSQSKIRELDTKQNKLIAEINRLENLGNKSEEASKAPERPKSGPRPSRATSKATSGEAATHSQMGSHRKKLDVSQPPSDMPPPYIPHHNDMPPPSDMPPTLEEHQTPSKSHEEPKKGNILTPPPSAPVFGQNPRAILKADIQAQNPGKKPFEIDAMLKQKLETDHAGKSAAEINQALKEHYEGQHPGKSHAEILEAVKAGGGQGPSGSPTGTPSKTTGEPSPQTQGKGTTEGKPQGGTPDFLSGLGDNPMARLKKVDPNAPRPTDKIQSQAEPEKTLQQQLEEAMAARRKSMNEEEKKSKVLTPDEQAEKERRKAAKQAEWDEGQ